MIFFFVVDMAGPVAPMLTGGTVNQLTGSEQLGRRSELGNGHRKGPYYRKKKKQQLKNLSNHFQSHHIITKVIFNLSINSDGIRITLLTDSKTVILSFRFAALAKINGRVY